MRLFTAVLVVATILKLLMATLTYGTNDVQFFEGYRATAVREGGVELYRKGIDLPKENGFVHHEGFWHPPFIVNLVTAVGAASDATGLPFPFVFRLLSILADVGTSILVWKLISADGPGYAAAACLVAGSPVLLLLSGFHGNTDPVMVFFLVLTTWLLCTGRHAALAGLAFGCSLSIKVWPVFLGLTFLLEVRAWRARAWFCAAAAGVFLAGAFPTLYQDPIFVVKQVMGYKSLFGHWGMARLISWIPLEQAGPLYADLGRHFVLVVAIGLSVLASRSGASLMLRCGLVTSSFLLLTPGFGIQYLAWLVPWVSVLGVEAMLAYSISAGTFMFVVYTYWSRGLPWYFGDSTVVGTWTNFLVWNELTCWLVILLLSWLFLNRGLRDHAGIEQTMEAMKRLTGWAGSPSEGAQSVSATPVGRKQARRNVPVKQRSR